MVEVEGVAYPLKQVFCETFGVGRHDVGTREAQRVLERLGFKVTRGEVTVRRRAPMEETRRRKALPPRFWDKQDALPPVVLRIPDIWLKWSYYERWEDIAGTGEHSEGIELPPPEPGVYEVYRSGTAAALYIGGTSHLRRRVRDGLVKGVLMHVAGQKMREKEDPAVLTVRWAVTERPAAAEEELLRRHVEEFGSLPEYTRHG